MSHGVFISWTRANGRTRDLAEELGIPAHFVYLSGRFGILGRYARQFIETVRLLRRDRPETTFLMLPPFPALLAVLAVRRRGTLVCDLHTGFFSDPKWRWATRMSLKLMRRADAVAIVTNERLQQVCSEHGVEAIVLHDRIDSRQASSTVRGHLLCPLSYANDEPVSQILDAARLTPHVTWVLTGAAPDHVRLDAPDNVHFSGYTEDEQYLQLLRQSGGVVALTTRPHTMQRAGYEAFNHGVPHLTSNFPELRTFYGSSARYTDATPESIAAEATALLQHREELQRLLIAIREQRTHEQHRVLTLLRERVAQAVPHRKQAQG